LPVSKLPEIGSPTDWERVNCQRCLNYLLRIQHPECLLKAVSRQQFGNDYIMVLTAWHTHCTVSKNFSDL